MKKAQIRAILLGIAVRLYLARELADDGDPENISYIEGVMDGAYHIASCEIVQYVFPLINLDDGLGSCDLRDCVETEDNTIKGILKRLEKLVYGEEKRSK